MDNNFSFSNQISPILKEKKEQRKVAEAVGLSLFALFGIMFGWSFVYFRILGNFGIPYENIIKITENPAVNELIQIAVSSLMLIIPSFILLRATHNKARDVVMLGRPMFKNKTAFCVASLGFCMFSSQVSNYLTQIFSAFGINFPSMERELPKGILGFLLVVLSTVIFPALLEEFMMRGVVLGVLKKFGDSFAIIASSLVFSLMHASLAQFAFAFLVGLLLGYITVKSKSIWPAVIIHAMNNFTSVAFSFIGEYCSTTLLNTMFLVFLLVVFTASGIALAKLSNDKEFLKIEKAETESTEKQKIKWFLTAPWMVVALCVAIAISIFLR